MKSSAEEGRYAKIAALAGVAAILVGLVAILVAYLAWQYPEAPRTGPKNSDPVGATTTPTATGPETNDIPRPSHSPTPDLPSAPSCRSLEIATLKATAPSMVASGLVTLSITPGQLGSEKFLTLGINSDTESRVETVLGASGRYSFKTSAGTYIINVTQVDFDTNTMTVQVVCEPKGTSR
jgi:hypothetical protein